MCSTMQAIVKIPWTSAVAKTGWRGQSHLHRGGAPAQGDLEGVDIEPGANVEDELLGEGAAELEGAADKACDLLGPVSQLLVEVLGV